MTIEGFRLSPQQRLLWELERHPPIYCAQCAITLKGSLDPGALKRAVQLIVNRHEILRTTFQQMVGLKTPIQVIKDTAAPFWTEANLESVGESEKPERIETLLRDQRGRPFDYENGPLFDLLLLRLGADEYLLSMRLPVLCADTLTLANLGLDLASFMFSTSPYQAEQDVLQYLQFSEWQNQLLEDSESKPGLDFWAGRGRGVGPSPRLPFAKSAGDGGSFDPRSLSVDLGPVLTAQVNLAVTECSTTLSSFLLACWQMLIWRLTGAADVVVATVIDGRKFEELQKGLGFFARTAPLHTRFNDGQRFIDVVNKVGETAKQFNDWQEFFVSINDGDQAGNEDFLRVAFEYVDWPETVAAGDLSLSFHRKYVCWDRFLIKLCCVRKKDSLTFEIEFDRSSIAEADVRRMAERLRALIEKAAATPRARVIDFEILTNEERAQLAAFNDTFQVWPNEKTIDALFEEQVEKDPSAIAVVFEDHHLSFGCLNHTADELAHRLQSLGVGPEIPVALLLDRSLEMVIGLLAVLKAGGAYVPVDTSLPKQRLKLLLEQTAAPVVITKEQFVENVTVNGAALIVLDRGDGGYETAGGGPDKRAVPENLAYILFTSGSTGRPKGVMVEHRQLTNYVRSLICRVIGPGVSSFAMVSTFAADLGNTVLFSSLCGGGCLHLLSQETAFDPDAFAAYFEERQIDCLKIVPSHFSNVLAVAPSAKVIPRKVLILGGEASSWRLIEMVSDLSPDCRILNHYGPTETTIGVMTHEFERGGDHRCEGGAPLGRPLPNLQGYLLDSRVRLAPTLVEGELYIGGAGLTRGYINDPQLTAEKFVPDSLSGKSGGRLYKTGDLARFLLDGCLKFLGRVDHQVKIRGFRVELGEIESELRIQPGVRDVVVELVGTGTADSRLVAYVVPSPRRRPSELELRSQLEKSLPNYMLPSTYVWVESLPLTPNGKVDRRSLPDPGSASVDQKGAVVSPRGFGESLLASLWGEVLGVSQLSVHDNFLSLGGDSLLATQLVSRVRRSFQVELPVHSIFNAPTIAEFSVVVERAMRGDNSPQPQPILPLPRNGDIPLSFAQERLWGIHQLDPQSSAYNCCAFWYLNGPLDSEILERALNEIVKRHEILRTTFSNVDGHPIQVISPFAPLNIKRLNLEDLPAEECQEEIRRIAELDKNLPFDLEHGPLMRVSLVDISPERHAILFTIHHIITDRWSFAILVRELSMFYDSFHRGAPCPLPTLPIQYADFARWQRQVLAGPKLDRLLSYWTRQLAGAPEVINLPIDYPRPRRQTFNGAMIFCRRPPKLGEALSELGRNEGSTIFMTLLSAFYVLLYHYTGQEDIVVGTDVANRNRVEIENLIGFFINNLALRADLSGNPTFRELLGLARVKTLEAYAHQDLPFATLVKALRVKRGLSHTPLFQVLFVLQNTPDAGNNLSTMQVEEVETEQNTSKFDLALFVSETKDGLAESWFYSTELFKFETISMMSSDFGILLESIVNQPDARLSELKPLGKTEDKKRSRTRWRMASQRSES